MVVVGASLRIGGKADTDRMWPAEVCNSVGLPLSDDTEAEREAVGDSDVAGERADNGDATVVASDVVEAGVAGASRPDTDSAVSGFVGASAAPRRTVAAN